MLKIYGKSTSINVRKVLWTCVELNEAFTQEDYGSGFSSTLTPEFLAMNPNGMVPVIQDDDVTLWESNVICRYLTQRRGRDDLLPNAAASRAKVEQWMDWQASELNNSWRYAFMSLVRQHADYQNPSLLTAGVAHWNHHMTILDAQLNRTGAFVIGETFTLADVVLGLSTHRWMAAPIAHAHLPAVTAYYDRLGARAGFMAHGRNGMP